MALLKNRFGEKVRSAWVGWWDGIYSKCGKNHADCLHHIFSPSTHYYVAGEHNKSIFNSCPLKNDGCHIGNEHKLHEREETIYLLKKVRAIVESDQLCYQLRDIDHKFLEVYAKFYE